jgi:peptidoglycan hydrolase CwlO-like protein
MEVEAQQRYRDKLTDLEARLQKVQTQLTELQSKQSEGNRLIASPEVTKAIEDYQQQSAALRGERREIRRALREDIDGLENRLLIANLVASPLLIGAFGLWFYRSRRR